MMAEVFDIRALTGSKAWRPLFTALLAATVASCGGTPDSPEQQLRAWVDRGHEAAERKDRDALVQMISPAYSDTHGNSRADIENLFRYYFLRANRVGLLVRVDNIEVFDDTAAQVSLTVAMGATTNSTPGFNADAYEFELELEKAADEWLLVSGRWDAVGNGLH